MEEKCRLRMPLSVSVFVRLPFSIVGAILPSSLDVPVAENIREEKRMSMISGF